MAVLSTVVILAPDKVQKRNSTAAEEIAKSSVSSPIRAGLVRKDIQPPKLIPTFPWIDKSLD